MLLLLKLNPKMSRLHFTATPPYSLNAGLLSPTTTVLSEQILLVWASNRAFQVFQENGIVCFFSRQQHKTNRVKRKGTYKHQKWFVFWSVVGNALPPLLSSSVSNHVCQCHDLLILGYKNLLISIRTATILTPPTSFLQLILASLSGPAAPNSKIKHTLLHKQKWEHKKNKREAGWSAHWYLFCLRLVNTQIPAKVPSVMRCRSWTATNSSKRIKKFSHKENVCLSATKQILFFLLQQTK
jgi:hypothetical protein